MYNQHVTSSNKDYIHVTSYIHWSQFFKDLGTLLNSEYPIIRLVHSLGIQLCGFTYKYSDILIKVFIGKFQYCHERNTWYAQLHSHAKYKWPWHSPSHQAVLIWVTHSLSQSGSHIEMLHQIIILGPEIIIKNETIAS